MVLRLFVPPGEGEHHLVPKRPDPLRANATLQYAVVSSTVLAAAYASFAAQHQRCTSPTASISCTALFVRASGRLGIWALAVGAAADVSYHHAFTALVLAQDVEHPQPPKLYDKTDKHTVEDGCLVGAAAGLMAFVPALRMRRPTVSWWARMAGLVNLVHRRAPKGPGRAGPTPPPPHARVPPHLPGQDADATLQSPGAGLCPSRCHFRAYHLPAELFDQPDQFAVLHAPTIRASLSADQAAENAAYYVAAPNWSDHLKALDADTIEAEIEGYERDKIAWLKDAEYMAYHLTVKQYEFVHAKHPTVEHIDRHNPTASIAEMEKLKDQFTNEVKTFESKVRSQAYEDVEKRGKWKKDLEDARTMLVATDRITDRIIWELENLVPKHQGKNEPTLYK